MNKIDEMKSLIKTLNEWSYYYYTLDNPIVSDYVYDEEYKKLEKLERETDTVLENSPTRRIGDVTLDKFEKYTHINRLFSLDKAQTIEGLRDFDRRVKKELNENPEYVVELKFDGLTVSLTYIDGYFKNAATRGNGSIGENVTEQVKRINSIPLSIEEKGTFEIQGEAIMPLNALEEYNKNHDEKLKNARNAAAGAIRNLNTSSIRERKIDVYFYNISTSTEKVFENDTDVKSFLRENNFKVSDEYFLCKDIEEAIKKVNYIETIRNKLNFLIDGAVIKVNSIRQREILGNTNKFPKWAIAYKYEAKQAFTKLKDVVWNVGRTAKVTPSAILEPVEIGGVTISRATLNNYDFIMDKNIKLNSRVLIRRSNDVIPEIIAVDNRGDDLIEIEKPTECPYCHSHLYQDGAHIFCPNTLSCKPQLIARLTHFCSRDAMNIEGLSEKTLEKLIEIHNLKDISEIYEITAKDLYQLEGFKDKKVNNMLTAIENSKKVNFMNFIYALGILNVGIKTANDLSKNFKSFEDLLHASFEEITKIPDIGPETAKSILAFFSDQNVKRGLEKIFSEGVTLIYDNQKENKNALEGLRFVVTGSFEEAGRKEIEQFIMDNGGKAGSSVSKNTNYLVLGKNPGSKYDKAVELNINIIDLNELKNLAGEK